MKIKQKIEIIQERIHQACERSGRDFSSVRLMLVTKFIPADRMQEAYDAGFRLFGENRVQELTQKLRVLPSDIEWHMIGGLQTNKVKYIAGRVRCIQSLDRLALAVEIERQILKNNLKILPCLLEINTTGESQKGGLNPESAVQFLDRLSPQSKIQIDGLMTMGPLTEDAREIRASFRKLVKLQGALRVSHPQYSWDTLSMGMSGDFEIAVEEGSTMIRVGSAIWGPREPKP